MSKRGTIKYKWIVECHLDSRDRLQCVFCIKWFDRKGVFSDHPWRQYKCIFCEEELQENCILKEHMWLLRMLDVFNGIYLWMFVWNLFPYEIQKFEEFNSINSKLENFFPMQFKNLNSLILYSSKLEKFFPMKFKNLNNLIL